MKGCEPHGRVENHHPRIESPVHPRSAGYPECGGCRPPAWIIGSSRTKWVHTATKHGTPEEARALKKALQQATTENHQLKQLLGEKDLEIAILHDLLKKAPRASLTDVK